MRLLILFLASLIALPAAEPAKDAAKDAKDGKDKVKKAEEAAVTPMVREFLAAIYQAGAQPTQEQCEKPMARLQARGPYDYDTPAARSLQRNNFSLLLKRQGQPIGLVELGHWNYLERAERAWYMVPCQHGMFFMHLVTIRTPDSKAPTVTVFEFKEDIGMVPRELVHPEVVTIRQPDAEADKTAGPKPPDEKPAP